MKGGIKGRDEGRERAKFKNTLQKIVSQQSLSIWSRWVSEHTDFEVRISTGKTLRRNN